MSGNNQVFSFEPDEKSRSVQQQNIRLNGLDSKVTLYGLAISNKNGREQFATEGGNANAHLVKDGSGNNLVECKTLNKLLEQLPAPTFVKIDTEGAEIDILSEASMLLENPKVKFICED